MTLIFSKKSPYDLETDTKVFTQWQAKEFVFCL